MTQSPTDKTVEAVAPLAWMVFWEDRGHQLRRAFTYESDAIEFLGRPDRGRIIPLAALPEIDDGVWDWREAVADMRRTAQELLDNANGNCNAVTQAIFWNARADSLEASQPIPASPPSPAEELDPPTLRETNPEMADARDAEERAYKQGEFGSSKPPPASNGAMPAAGMGEVER